jgi:hypothetical protein
MKRFLIFMVVWSFGFGASDLWGQQTIDDTNYLSVTNFRNNPLPKHPVSLKILGIGNSFTEDGMQYLPDLLKHAGLDNVTLGRLVIGGCSLEKHDQVYMSGDTAYRYDKSYPGKNKWETVKGKCSFTEGVSDEAWDVMVIQQVSQKAGQYETYQPYLNRLISAMVTNGSNAGVSLAWQMTWAYGQASNHGGFANYDRNQQQMYDAIVQATRRMVSETGIDLVIPSATTIQYLRKTPLNNPPLDFTRDGFHIDLGAGRYALACTWFQTLIAPCFGTTILGNTFRIDAGAIPVNDENCVLLQKAAQQACVRRFDNN